MNQRSSRTDWRVVGTNPTRVLRKLSVVGKEFKDAFKIIANGIEVARRKLRVSSTRVEEGRRRWYIAVSGHNIIKLFGPLGALFFTFLHSHTHSYTHPKRLRSFQDNIFTTGGAEEVPIIENLQAHVVEQIIAIEVHVFSQLINIKVQNLFL